MGIHSRIDATIARIADRARVGNLYVNRNMIGAVVGVQPFGGEGLSGTGPKAGGPHYLPRFAVERTRTVNIAAAGGNAALLAQDRLTDDLDADLLDARQRAELGDAHAHPRRAELAAHQRRDPSAKRSSSGCSCASAYARMRLTTAA
jgi:delta 1-pyrroline-5-carboxylate dehydrogenase